MAQQKVVLKVLNMTDGKTKQKEMKAAAGIYGIDSIAADVKEQTLTVTGNMDILALSKKLEKLGKVRIISVVPAEEENPPAPVPAPAPAPALALAPGDD